MVTPKGNKIPIIMSVKKINSNVNGDKKTNCCRVLRKCTSSLHSITGKLGWLVKRLPVCWILILDVNKVSCSRAYILPEPVLQCLHNTYFETAKFNERIIMTPYSA